MTEQKKPNKAKLKLHHVTNDGGKGVNEQFKTEDENIFINKFRNFSNFANHLFAVRL